MQGHVVVPAEGMNLGSDPPPQGAQPVVAAVLEDVRGVVVSHSELLIFDAGSFIAR
jgi:hypothetical protein